MRISDWSSDVCSSDLSVHRLGFVRRIAQTHADARAQARRNIAAGSGALEQFPDQQAISASRTWFRRDANQDHLLGRNRKWKPCPALSRLAIKWGRGPYDLPDRKSTSLNSSH